VVPDSVDSGYVRAARSRIPGGVIMASQFSGAPLGNGVKTNTPLYSFATLALFVVGIVVLIVTDNEDDGGLFIALAISTIPSLVASLFAERAARDIRNGVLQSKAKAGAQEALDETGVTATVEATQRGESSALAMAALARLLEQNTDATIRNTEGKNNDGR
jgi:hypothetical protein